MPSKRTLVKVAAGKYCIDFRTVTWREKSPRRFAIVREDLENLSSKTPIIVSDIHSFAVLRLNEATGLLTINFTWLNSTCGGGVSGREESVAVPYSELLDFMRESTQENGPREWKHLSVSNVTRPKLIFHARKRLQECLENKTVRRKLAHALMRNFNSPMIEQVHFYHDFEPYSFMFDEVRSGQNFVSGGFIFHNLEDDLNKAFYLVHT